MSHSRFSQQFTMSALARDDEVRDLLRRLRAQLSECGVGEPTCASAEIVLAEALNNIAEHAYAGRPLGQVQVCTQISPGSIRFSLRDHGAALPGNQLPEGKLPETEVPLDDLPEGGFGWYLIRTLSSSITYDHSDEGNYLVVTLPNGQDR